MLTREQAEERLKAFRTEDNAARWLAEFQKLPERPRLAGYALLGHDEQGKKLELSWYVLEAHHQNSSRLLTRLKPAERRQLFQTFAPRLAPAFEQLWDSYDRLPYQTGYSRKSFRTRGCPELVSVSRFAGLHAALNAIARLKLDEIDAAWLAAWTPHLGYGADHALSRLLAAVIDAGGKEADAVFGILVDSGKNEHEIGAMGRHVVRALLTASRPDGWEFVEKLLLAAQRQEGLRQVVLESIDEAHPQAFRRMLKLIIDEELVRFSAVVRAVDVWFGFAWDSQSVKVINTTLRQALEMLDDEAARAKALSGKDPEAAFLALWATAFDDAAAAVPLAAKLLGHKSPEMRFAALTLLSDLNLPLARPALLAAMDDSDLRIASHAACSVPRTQIGDEVPGEDDYFERVEKLLARMPEKPAEVKPLVWPWAAGKLDREDIARLLTISLGQRPPTRLIPYLKSFDRHSRIRVVSLLAEQKRWDAATRDTLLALTGDAVGGIREAALTALHKCELAPHEVETIERLLTRKAADLRRGVLALLVNQSPEGALASADRLLAAKDAAQRMAGLELLRLLAKKVDPEQCRQRAAAYQQQAKKLSKDERTQLEELLKVEQPSYTLENALGLINPADRTPPTPPVHRGTKFVTPATMACLQALDNLVHEHRETQIEVKMWRGTEQQLLGNVGYGFPSPDWKKPREGQAANLPLAEVWQNWFANRPRDCRDKDGMELVRVDAWLRLFRQRWSLDHWRKWTAKTPERQAAVATLTGDGEPPELRYAALIDEIAGWLLFLQPPAGLVDFALDAVETSFSIVPAADLERLKTEDSVNSPHLSYYAELSEDALLTADWREQEPFQYWTGTLGFAMHSLCPEQVTDEQRIRRWRLMHWRDEPLPGARRKRVNFDDLLYARAAGHATDADVLDHLLGPRHRERYGYASFDSLRALTDPKIHSLITAAEDLQHEHQLVERCRERILEIELARGETVTAATDAANSLGSLYGTPTLVRILTALGKNPLVVGRAGKTKGEVFTHLLSNTFPESDDTPEAFKDQMKAAIKAGHFPEDRVLPLVFLAPQWLKHVTHYYGWPELPEGVYWFLAHMRDTASVHSGAGERAAGVAAQPEPEPAETESENGDGQADRQRTAWARLIAERTPLSDEDRGAGAVDVGWFQRTYADLGPKRWQAVFAAARFAASPQQAKKAQTIADVLTGKAKRKTLVDNIKQKHLKDNVRLLGLLPLAAGAKRDADIQERYKVLQDYRRYAKTLSMAREDALRASDIALDNLARTAGYPDPLRLQWALEAQSLADLAKGPVSATAGGITITLALDENSQPQTTVDRAGKPLKSAPPAVKKDKKVAALLERVPELKRSASRIKQSLETAMCRGDELTGAELAQLAEHPLVWPVIARLVLLGEGIAGYPDKKGKALRDHAGKLEPVKKNERLRIAHPHDLFAGGHWEAWQHECFGSERLQPFKQVFRELYVITAQEKKDGALSQRYSGQQIQPTQATALFNQRGWSTREGISRTFHDLQLSADVSFKYGGGTPLEVEGWTIEAVSFRRRDQWKPLPLADVPPRVFSEVMRDLDLVVSVAHRGGVDPEASASTVEMRASLLRETCALLKLDNVRFKNAHALIDGALASYSLHLGSGIVHKLPGGSLCIVPVHAQHRGRLFLPFADDDPRTAEVISKTLLLARDREIQDPTILEQLRM